MRLLVPLPLLVLAATASAQSVVGTWSVQDATPRPGIGATVAFTKAGKLAVKIRGTQGGRKVAVNMSGTWAVKGNQLTTKLTDASPDPSMLAGLTAAQKKQMATPQFKEMFRKRGTAAGGPYGTIKFLGKDKFELKDRRGTSTFTRVRG